VDTKVPAPTHTCSILRVIIDTHTYTQAVGFTLHFVDNFYVLPIGMSQIGILASCS
jgi:hypothetical protein